MSSRQRALRDKAATWSAGRSGRGNHGPGAAPRRILVTGGASCPDGIIQQVISRINTFYPAGDLRDIEVGAGRPPE